MKKFTYQLSHSKGFTLVELMITLVIAGILMSYAIPSYRQFGLRQNISNQANNLVTDLMFAKVMAVKYGQNINVESKNGLDWSDGWEIYIDSDHNLARNGADDVLLRDEDEKNATLSSTLNSLVSFDGLGSVQASGINAIAISHAGIAGNITVNVSLSGLITSTSTL